MIDETEKGLALAKPGVKKSKIEASTCKSCISL